MYNVAGKVALVTGGGAGIGFWYAKELLRNGLRAVTLADISEENGETSLKKLEKEFGPNKVLYVKTDVTNRNEFENAFKMTIAAFKNIDILVNNAGVMNDSIWKKQVETNFVAVVYGCLLAVNNYISKYKTEENGVVVNVSSISGLEKFEVFPIYAATKHAIVGLTRSWGMDSHYVRTKVRFLALCPGATDTPLMSASFEKHLGPVYKQIIAEHLPQIIIQPPQCVGRALVDIIQKGENGSVWVAERSQPPYEVEIPSRIELRKSQKQPDEPFRVLN